MLLTLAAAALIVRAQPPVRDVLRAAGVGVIRGRVSVAGADLPVRKARVTVVPSSGDTIDPVYTDGDGRYEIAEVPAGRAVVTAWKSGYAPGSFGARSPAAPPVSVVVGPASAVDGIDIALTRAAAIAGRVTDEFGEPLLGMTVSAGRMIAAAGRPHFQQVGLSISTDDLGEYRIGGLPPDAYVVAVFGAPSTAALSRGIGRRAYAVFYPQGSLLPQARVLTVRAGEELTGIDVTIAAGSESVFTVMGRVTDAGGQPAPANVIAIPIADGVPGMAVARSTARTAASGEFSLVLGPGAYTVIAQDGDVLATTEVRVDRHDVSGVELALTRGARIRGRVRAEGADPPPLDRIVVVGGSPAPTASGGSAVDDFQRTTAKSDGSFELSGLVGVRQIGVGSLPPGWTVKSITAGGRSIADIPIDFKGGEEVRDVTIVLTDRRSELDGVVEGESGGEVSVLVYADDPRQLPRRARWVRPDRTGHFLVSDLPPGAYWVAAVRDVDDRRWSTPEYLAALRPVATRVALVDGERASVTVAWSGAR